MILEDNYLIKLNKQIKINMKTKIKKVAVTPNNGSFRVRRTTNGWSVDRTFKSKRKAVEFRNSLYA